MAFTPKGTLIVSECVATTHCKRGGKGEWARMGGVGLHKHERQLLNPPPPQLTTCKIEADSQSELYLLSPPPPARRYDNWRVQEVDIVTGEHVRYIGEHHLVSPTGVAAFGDFIAVSGACVKEACTTHCICNTSPPPSPA